VGAEGGQVLGEVLRVTDGRLHVVKRGGWSRARRG
jgi:hypothetical protein